MAHATVGKDGKFTGTVYSEFTKTVKDWHDQNGFTCIPIEENYLPNTSTDDEPYYAIPTKEQLKEAARQAAKRSRDEALNAMTHTWSDGSVVQVRPQDMPQFKSAIEIGTDQRWVLLDNTTRLTTVTEMQEAMNSGLAQGKAIWDQYADDLESLALNATTSE